MEGKLLEHRAHPAGVLALRMRCRWKALPTWEVLSGSVHAQTVTPRGVGRTGRVADRAVGLRKPGSAGP